MKTSEVPMMKCGHTAQGTNADGKPVCVLCIGITAGAEEVADAVDLTGRVARCADCGKETPSSETLAFFGYRPNAKYDSYYSGCRGWN